MYVCSVRTCVSAYRVNLNAGMIYIHNTENIYTYEGYPHALSALRVILCRSEHMWPPFYACNWSLDKPFSCYCISTGLASMLPCNFY